MYLDVSLEFCMLLALLISIGLNLYLAPRVIRANKATETFGLKEVIRHVLYRKSVRCAEITDRDTPPSIMSEEIRRRGLMLCQAENEFNEAAKIARAIGYPVSQEWTDLYEELRPIPRKLGYRSDPTHEPLYHE